MKKFPKVNKSNTAIINCSVARPNASGVMISVGKKRENISDREAISYDMRKQRMLSFVATLGTSLESIMSVGAIPSNIGVSNRLSLSLNPRNAMFKLMESLSQRNITGDEPLQSIVIVGCYSDYDSIVNVNPDTSQECIALKNKAEFYDSGNNKAPHIIGAVVEIQRVHKERTRVRDIVMTKNSAVKKMEANRYLYRLVVHYGGTNGFLASKIAIQLGFSLKDLIPAEKAAANLADSTEVDNEAPYTDNKYFDSLIWYGYNSSSEPLCNNNACSVKNQTKYQGVRSVRNRNIYKVRFKRLAVL